MTVGFFKTNLNVRPQLSRLRLVGQYVVPPFSVLDARQGYWQERKREWLALGIQSELGRGQELISGDGHCSNNGRLEWAGNRAGDLSAEYKARAAASFTCGGPEGLGKRYKQGKAIPGGGTGKQNVFLFRHQEGYEAADGAINSRKDGNLLKFSATATIRRGGVGFNGSKLLQEKNKGLVLPDDVQKQGSGTSIFDPVLCEIMYRWFCPKGGKILDPFAGGSVRGIIASVLERHYTGIDLSPYQIASNQEQAKRIVPDNQPRWIVGDSLKVKSLAPESYDFIFSCPPYFDLEKYSDHPRDISNMSHEDFLRFYRKIILRSCSMLKDNRFACFVVGNTRGADHNYTHLPQRTIDAFEEAGAKLYNEAILVTAVGSLPLRTKKQFESGRKLGRTHQHVLIFCKGDFKRATKACKRQSASLKASSKS